MSSAEAVVVPAAAATVVERSQGRFVLGLERCGFVLSNEGMDGKEDGGRDSRCGGGEYSASSSFFFFSYLSQL